MGVVPIVIMMKRVRDDSIFGVDSVVRMLYSGRARPPPRPTWKVFLKTGRGFLQGEPVPMPSSPPLLTAFRSTTAPDPSSRRERQIVT